MELLDRYLQALRGYLPESHRDDIIKELSDDLRSHMEDREAELGRPLDDSEREAILKRYGHPMVVAGRYLPPRHLIGPGLFPVYWFTLKIVLWAATLIYLVIVGTTSFAARLVEITDVAHVPSVLSSPMALVSGGLVVLIITFGWVTLLFAGLEYWQAKIRLLDQWSPRRLAPLPVLPWEQWRRPPARSQAIAGLIAGAISIFFWQMLSQFPTITVNGSAMIKAGPAWEAIRWLWLAFIVSGLLEACVSLVRPHWARFRPVLHLARVAGLIVTYFVLRNADLLAPARIDTLARRVAEIANTAILYSVVLALTFSAAFYGLELLGYLRRWIERRRSPDLSVVF